MIGIKGGWHGNMTQKKANHNQPPTTTHTVLLPWHAYLDSLFVSVDDPETEDADETKKDGHDADIIAVAAYVDRRAEAHQQNVRQHQPT